MNRGHGAAGGVLPQEAPEEAEEIRARPVRRGSVSDAVGGQRQQPGDWPHLQSPQVHFQVTQVTCVVYLVRKTGGV